MKSASAMLGLLTASAGILGACQGVHWANLLTLGVTATLFFGTLHLGKRGVAPSNTTNADVAPSVVRPNSR